MKKDRDKKLEYQNFEKIKQWLIDEKFQIREMDTTDSICIFTRLHENNNGLYIHIPHNKDLVIIQVIIALSKNDAKAFSSLPFSI